MHYANEWRSIVDQVLRQGVGNMITRSFHKSLYHKYSRLYHQESVYVNEKYTNKHFTVTDRFIAYSVAQIIDRFKQYIFHTSILLLLSLIIFLDLKQLHELIYVLPSFNTAIVETVNQLFNAPEPMLTCDRMKLLVEGTN